jgi:hypothetical protein
LGAMGRPGALGTILRGAMVDEDAFLTLNALYLKKMASVGDLAKISGVSAEQVQALVNQFVEQDWVLDMGEEVLIQPEGMTEVQDYYRQNYADLSQREEMAAWFARFEPINKQFIKHVSDWQQTGGDSRDQDRVIATVERLIKLIGEIAQLVPRYSGYIRRFERSVTEVDEGNPDFVCTPTVDSLHNIWFEFHEDFLMTLGKERTE